MADRYEAPRSSGGSNADDPAAIRAEIQRTRERMDRTVDELGYRLNPERLKGRVKRNLHDATVGKAEDMARRAAYRADETRHSIMDTLRDNPVPAAMVGIGLGWLMVNSKRDDDSEFVAYRGYARGRGGPFWDDDLEAQRYRAGIDRWDDEEDSRLGELKHSASETGHELKNRAEREAQEARERVRQEAHEAKDRVTDIAYEARDSARHLVDRAQGSVEAGADRARSLGSEMADRTRRGAHRMEDRFDSALHDAPLAIGAAAVAFGMAVGMGLPSTRRESELMGPKRDELIDRARGRADEMASRAKHVAERVADEAKSTAREAARDEGLTGDQASRGQGESFGGPMST